MTIKDYSTGELPEDGEARWTTDEMTKEFEVLSFSAPYVVVRRKSDGVLGSLQFQHSPRIYFDFVPKSPPPEARKQS